MKTLKYILLSTIFLSLFACNELDDVEATFRVAPENIIANEASALTILNEIYARSRSTNVRDMAKLQSGMGLTDADDGLSFNTGFEEANDFLTNTPRIDSEIIADLYQSTYLAIQQAASFIETMEEFTPAENVGGTVNKNSLIGEARFVRGLMHFYLLRAFGEFYDTSSDFGIVLRMSPASSTSIPPRNTVAESYTAIYEDLDFAIENCISTETFRGNAEAARAIKAKVLLYEGRYAEAAELAEDILNSTTKSFATDYSANYTLLNVTGSFQLGEILIYLGNIVAFPHESPEVFFIAFTNGGNVNVSDAGEGFRARRPVISESRYAEIARGNPLLPEAEWDPRSIPKYASQVIGAERIPGPQIHMRLAELYLIHAEAAARATGDLNASAIASLNTVRTRPILSVLGPRDGVVNLDPLAPASNAELLEAIRTEKLLELFGENGEDFFDLIRYEMEGDLLASSEKPTMNNKDFYIFPIPRSEFLLLGSENLVQNPGYDRQ